ncbi:MAG: hypothetical protein ABIR86_09435 [Sphingomicrobium sp.]
MESALVSGLVSEWALALAWVTVSAWVTALESVWDLPLVAMESG